MTGEDALGGPERGADSPPDSQATLSTAVRLASFLAVAKLLFQFALTAWTSQLGYGYFRDEFYYLACGHHLAWGYVDHGPLVALQAWAGEILFGTSVFGIRILSAFAGALMVFLTGLLARLLGGRPPAQVLAMLAVIATPEYLALDGFLSMNSYEPVFWTACVLGLFMALHGRVRGGWLLFGLSAGIGLLNKPSMAFFLVAACAGLLVTGARRVLFSRWAALGIALLVLIALPNVLWQFENHWPTLEFLRDGELRHKNVHLNPLQFSLAQLKMMQPLNAAVWIAGLVSLLRGHSIRDGRWLGVAYLFFFPLMLVLHAKDYYLAGIYPALFAAGGVAWERRFEQSQRVVNHRPLAFPRFQGALLGTSLLLLPLCSPVLAPSSWVRYTAALHLHGDQLEVQESGPLPQFYADRFGWDELTNEVVGAYRTLSPEDQHRVCLLTGNFGEAGALDLLGHAMEPSLPPAVSAHNSYWMWGTHGCTWEVVIGVYDASPAEMAEHYESVTVMGRLDNPYAMPYEHKYVYLLRSRRASQKVIWDEWKDYI